MSHIRALIAVLVFLPGIHLPTLLMGLASSQPSCFCIINTSLNEPCKVSTAVNLQLPDYFCPAGSCVFSP